MLPESNGIIRQALPADAPAIAPLLLLAMGSLADYFTSGSNREQQIQLFTLFIQKTDNQYSFENTMVYEENNTILGASNGYDGSKLIQLRKDFVEYITQQYNVDFPETENETEPGEFYIDCVCVSPVSQGKGIGKKLLSAMLNKGKTLGFSRVGLLVNIHNIKAKKLYEDLGFKVVKNKKFMGDDYYHMQYSIPN